ncbi:MAG: tripartite tricarboxylate transporter substrate binding protein, partial [Proteobacteria bacterium]|nr:tripartite tricarboxylate transporter substrate binding protein [Pseudomonadota bacterium]
MKRALRALAVSAFILVPATTASAQSGDYPNRPVRMINPYAPGGAVDVIARTFSQKLNEALGQ